MVGITTFKPGSANCPSNDLVPFTEFHVSSKGIDNIIAEISIFASFAKQGDLLFAKAADFYLELFGSTSNTGKVGRCNNKLLFIFLLQVEKSEWNLHGRVPYSRSQDGPF